MNLVFASFFFLSQVWLLKSQESPPPPNIIFIYADDLGWNDVSLHGSPEIPTPNIDALALSGITLNNYYGERLCTPSRAALLSGKYPIRLGLQHFLIVAGQDIGLPLDVTTLPQHLKRLGYDTHMVGKWHLGYSKTEYFPTKRGFDTFLGYLNGFIGYYDFTHYSPAVPHYYGIDLRNGTKLIKDFRGEYTPYVFANQAKNVILNHNTDKPLFLYLSALAVHSGNPFQPFQAPPEVVSKFKYIKDINRRIHAAVMSTLDDTVGTVFETLHQRDMLKNSIVMFVSDNGGQTKFGGGAGGGASSNYPLRGQKASFWEGAVRIPAVIWSPLLQLDKPRVSKQLMYVADWMPTFYRAAGGDLADLGPIDGLNMWDTLKYDLPSPRRDILLNLDPIEGESAYRLQHLKVVNGSTPQGLKGWYGPSGLEYINQPSSMYQHVFENGSTVRDILMKSGWWIADQPDEIYREARIVCEEPPPVSANSCDPDVKPCLFNITTDPCEYSDLADQFPHLVSMMMNRVERYQKHSAKPQLKPVDPRADPRCHGFAHVPWLDPEHLTSCDYFVEI